MQLSRSPKTARDYVKDLEQTMQALNYFPERYRKTPSGKYRRVNFKKYAIFYFIENDTVHIIDVILASSSTVLKRYKKDVVCAIIAILVSAFSGLYQPKFKM